MPRSITLIYATLNTARIAAEDAAIEAGDWMGYARQVDPATLLDAADMAVYRAQQAADIAAYLAAETVPL